MKKTGQMSPSSDFLITIFLIAIATFLVGAYAYYRSETARILQEKYQEIAAIADMKTSLINQWRFERKADVEALCNGPLFRQALEQWFGEPKDQHLEIELKGQLETIRQAYQYFDVLIVNPEGRILVSASPDPLPLDPDEERNIPVALGRIAPVLTELHRNSQDVVMIDGIGPILDSNARPIALGVLRIRADKALSLMVNSWPNPEKAAETVLIRKEGNDALVLNISHQKPNSAFSSPISTAAIDNPFVQAVLGKAGMFQGMDYRGVEVLADLRPIPDSSWFVVSKIDSSDILGGINYRFFVMGLLIFFILSGGAIAYVFRHRQAAIYQDLYRSEKQQRETQEEFRTTLYSIGDAVITTDRQGLVKQMNRVAEQLTGWLESEARSKPLENVFRVLYEESREVVDHPMQQVLQLGKPTENNDATELISKDGSGHPISYSGAPITEKDGSIIGVVLVFRDQTRVRTALQKLRINQQRLRIIADHIYDWEYWITPNNQLEYCSPSCQSVTGYRPDEFMGNPHLLRNIIHPDDLIAYDRHVAHDMHSSEFRELDYRIISHSGDVVWLSHCCTPVYGDAGEFLGRRVSNRDVTGRKQAEVALKESEERYRLLFRYAPLGIVQYDQDGSVIDCNDTFAAIMGAPREKIFGFNMLGRIKDPEMLKAIHDSLDGKIGSYEGKYRSVTTGKLTPVRVIGTRILSDAGDFLGAIAMFEDISERTLIEEALAQERWRFQSLAENSPFGMVVIQPDGTFSYINPKFKEMFGYDSNDVPNGKHWFRNAFPDAAYRHEVISAWIEDVRGQPLGETRPRAYTVRCKNGSDKIIRFRPVRLISGEDLMTCVDITESKRAERQITEAKEQWERTFNAVPEVVTILGPDHQILQANRATSETFGLDIQTIIGRKCYEVIHRSDAPPDYCPHTKSMKNGREHTAQVAIDRLGATLDVSTSPLFDANGTLMGSVHVARDITERMLMEQALKESEEKYRTVLQCSPIPVAVYDQSGLVTYINPAFQKTFGWSQQELIGQKIDYVPEEKQAEAALTMKRLYEGGDVPSFETTRSTKDGKTLDVYISAALMKDSRGVPIGNVVTLLDISQRKRMEKALRASEEANALLIQESPVGIGIVQGGKYVYANPALVAMMGCDGPEEVVGKSPLVFIAPEDRDQVQRRGKARLEGEDSPVTYQVEGLTKDGVRVDATIWPKRTNYLSQPAILTFVLDVTEEHRLRSQLVQAQKMEAVGTLAGGIAHDFNNLLQVVLGYAGLMIARKQPDDREYRDLQRILEAGSRGADLVENLLMFSRKVIPELRPINLNDEVVQIQKLLSRTIPKTIQNIVLLSENLEPVLADTSQVGQVLMNLAVNARDAMPNGGTLTFETTNIELDEAFCAAHLGSRPGNYVSLTVSDTGEGMDEATVAHIFEPFFTTKEPGRGTGLGLSTVYGIVKQHSGYITCCSEPGVGTTFRIYLPAIQRETESDAEAVETEIRGGTETILVVDDEDMIRDLTTELLSNWGYRVMTAADGREALEIYGKEGERISLVILDLIMPMMDGKQCLSEVLRRDPSAKVLIASGCSEHAPSHKMDLLGAKGFVEKPYDVEKLLRTIRDVLDEN